MNVHFIYGNSEGLLHTELDIFHNIVGYFADTHTVFKHNIQIDDDPLIYDPYLNTTAAMFTLQHL